jgi:hypothetical protein
MADLDKVKRNVAKMVGQNAPEEDIDSYLSGEGVTVDQIRAHKVGASQPAPEAARKQPSTFGDVVKSGASGLAEGAAAVVGLPGDISNLLDRGADYLTGGHVADHQPATRVTSDKVNRGIQSITGEYHKPETTAGRYAETIASFAPGALAPGGMAARAVRVVAPGAASEAAGEAAGAVSPGLEPYARAIGAVAGAGVPALARIGVSAANRAATSAFGSGFLDPTKEATRRLTSAFAADGGLDSALGKSDSFERSGASAPSVLDLGGGNVRRLVRAAAGGGGPAETRALSYSDQVRSNLQDNVINRAGQLTPDYQGSAAQLGAELEANQGRLANEQYREPYRQPATVTPEMVDALQGSAGRSAIARARAAAEDTRDAQQMAELSDLESVASGQGGGRDPITGRVRSIQQALSELSAGSLDRVRFAMRERGRALAASGQNVRAGGHFGRVRDIDTALDQTPRLTEARDSYRQMQAGRDSLDTGAQVLKLPSTEYAGQIADLASRGASARLGPPNLGQPLRVSARQAITDAVESPAQGATGVLNRIGTSARATANLASTFGSERASPIPRGRPQ